MPCALFIWLNKKNTSSYVPTHHHKQQRLLGLGLTVRLGLDLFISPLFQPPSWREILPPLACLLAFALIIHHSSNHTTRVLTHIPQQAKTCMQDIPVSEVGITCILFYLHNLPKHTLFGHKVSQSCDILCPFYLHYFSVLCIFLLIQSACPEIFVGRAGG